MVFQLTYLETRSSFFGFLVSGVLGCLLLAGCEKFISVGPPTTNLSVVHAAPGSPPFNFYYDQLRVNTNELNYLSRIHYFKGRPGLRELEITTSDFEKESKLKESIDLGEEKYYSLFVTGKADLLEYLLVEDDYNRGRSLVSDSTNIRFIHLSPDTGPLELLISGKESVQSGRLTYKGYNKFTQVPPGTYTLKIIDPATRELKASLADVELLPAVHYSFYASGLSNTLDDEQRLGIKLAKTY